jgi:hypothetical protein
MANKKAPSLHCAQKVRHFLGVFLWAKTENIALNSGLVLSKKV